MTLPKRRAAAIHVEPPAADLVFAISLSGRHVNRLPVSEDTLQQANNALQFMCGEAEKMMAEAHKDADSS